MTLAALTPVETKLRRNASSRKPQAFMSPWKDKHCQSPRKRDQFDCYADARRTRVNASGSFQRQSGDTITNTANLPLCREAPTVNQCFHEDIDVSLAIPYFESMTTETTLLNLSTQELRKVVTLKEQIENLQSQLAETLGGEIPIPGKKRTMSASARKRIAAAQRERWAKLREGKKAASPGKRTMSASARARIGAAQKARWARLRKGKPAVAEAAGRSGKGELKARIIEHIKASGKQGISIKELVPKLNSKYANVIVWFQTTGKKVKEIKKMAPGRYAWRA